MVERGLGAYVKLPSLHMLPGFLARDNHDKLGDLSTNHPLIQLRHNLLNVGFHLVVG